MTNAKQKKVVLPDESVILQLLSENTIFGWKSYLIGFYPSLAKKIASQELSGDELIRTMVIFLNKSGLSLIVKDVLFAHLLFFINVLVTDLDIIDDAEKEYERIIGLCIDESPSLKPKK